MSEVKMIMHKHYDRNLKKFIHTMVPQSKEHAARSKSIDKAMAKAKDYKPDSSSTFKKFGKIYHKRAYNE